MGCWWRWLFVSAHHEPHHQPHTDRTGQQRQQQQVLHEEYSSIESWFLLEGSDRCSATKHHATAAARSPFLSRVNGPSIRLGVICAAEAIRSGPSVCTISHPLKLRTIDVSTRALSRTLDKSIHHARTIVKVRLLIVGESGWRRTCPSQTGNALLTSSWVYIILLLLD